MSNWSKAGKRVCLLEPNGFVTSDQGKLAKVPGPNSYNTGASPRIRGTIAQPPYEKAPYTKSDRDKILSNGVKMSTISPIGPGEYTKEHEERGGAPPPGMTAPSSPSAKSSPRKSEGKEKGKRSNSPLAFGGSGKRSEIYDTKDVPGPGAYEIKLPAVSSRGKFLSTSPRKVCSPVEKERPPQLSPTQQEWFNRTSSQGIERGGSGEHVPSPPLDASLGNSFNNNQSGGIGRRNISPPTLSPRALGQQQSGTWGQSNNLSPTLSGSFGRSANSNMSSYARAATSHEGGVRSPRVKGGYISSSPRSMNMHNPNSTLAREKDPDFANPAPGAYDSNYKKSSDRHLGGRISQSPRNTSLISPKVGLIPGPGSYDSNGGGSFAGTSAIQI